MIISAYSESSYLKNYVRVVAVESDLQRVSFHDVADFLFDSIVTELLSLYTHKEILFEFQNLVTVMKSHCQFCM